MKICRSIRLDQGRRVLLHRWSDLSEDQVNNIVCVDDLGGECWRAKLPINGIERDCFVALNLDGATLVAKTFSGMTLHLDPQTGDHVD